MSFEFASILPDDLPPPAQPWNGFPRYNFVGGHNDAASVPVDDLVAAAAGVLKREGSTLATYGLESGPQGYQPLRRFIADTLNRRTGMQAKADDVLVTSGSLQALDLVNRTLLRPGDTVLIEQDTYGGALSRLDALGVNYVGIPLDGDGMRTDTLAEALERLKIEGTQPKYIYTIPTVQNPTGTVMPKERRIQLLQLADRYQVPIFEDDCYADLLWGGERPPAITAMDDGDRVVYCGSFSKSIAPALRVGYIVASWPLMSRILPIKTDAGSGALEQMVLAEYCQTNFDNHVETLKQTLKGKCNAIVDALEAEFGTSAEFSVPKGGIFIWVTLPEEVDTTRLAQVAAAEGVAINPGAEWSTDKQGGRRRLRLCFGHPPVDTIRDGIARLADICHREFGVPLRGANVAR